MKIEVRLFASLRKNREKKVFIEIELGSTARQVAETLNIPADQISMTLINGRPSGLDAIINDQDIISFFPSIGGG